MYIKLPMPRLISSSSDKLIHTDDGFGLGETVNACLVSVPFEKH